uniref:Uncharacterized protein n=1 Tax=Anopheles culicifacies TaxID=139723 RepID=A0A182LTC1_9DIPT
MESTVGVNVTSLAWPSSSAMPTMLLPDSTYGSFPAGGVTMSLDVLLSFGLFEANGTIDGNATIAPAELPHPCDPSSNDFDCSVKDFLVYARGPQRMPLFTAMLVSSVWLIPATKPNWQVNRKLGYLNFP